MSSSTSESVMAFGYKQQWLAVPKVTPLVFANALGLGELRTTSWAEGVLTVNSPGQENDRFVFVTPSVNGWTLAVGRSRGIPQARNPAWIHFLEKLSARLGQVQYFGTHRVVGYHAWAKAVDGHLVRAFAYSGETSETLVNLGEPTPEEIELGFDFVDERSASLREMDLHEQRVEEIQSRIDSLTLDRDVESLSADEHAKLAILINKLSMMIPDEDSVSLVANRWSVDPMQLRQCPETTEPGLLGMLLREPWGSPNS